MPFLVLITPVCLCYYAHQEHSPITSFSLEHYSVLIVNLGEHEWREIEAVLAELLAVLVLVELVVLVLGVLWGERVSAHLVQQ